MTIVGAYASSESMLSVLLSGSYSALITDQMILATYDLSNYDVSYQIIAPARLKDLTHAVFISPTVAFYTETLQSQWLTNGAPSSFSIPSSVGIGAIVSTDQANACFAAST